MTYTEIIDNIQTRIENLISERFTGTYFNIKIEPSNYNPDIDDTITVTITVTDQNDDPIPNWTVPLTINGTAITGTLTTNANGVATYNYTCSEWGVCRFSVKSCSTHINVTGLKQVKQRVWSSSNNLTYTLYVDESSKIAVLKVTASNISIASGITNYEIASFIPSEYRPLASNFTRIGRSNNTLVYVWQNGAIGISNFSSSTLTGQTYSGQVDWHY